MKTRCLSLLVSLPLAAVSNAALVSLTPVADAFVTTGPGPSGSGTDLSGNNYGGAGAMAVSGNPSGKGIFQSVMRFDMSTVVSSFDLQFGAGNWKIDSVTLRLTSAAANNPIFNAVTSGSFSIRWMADDSWTEGSGSPNSPGASGVNYTLLQTLGGVSDTSLGTYSFDGTTGTTTNRSLGLPEAFVNDIKGGGSLGLRVNPEDAGIGYVFNSRSFGTEANRPLLTIEASMIPEPGVALLVPASALLWIKRRRRHAARA